MISKNSYFDLTLIIDKIRKNAWIITLYSVILFFSMPIYLAIKMQGASERMRHNGELYIIELVLSFFRIDNKFIVLLTIPAAIIAAATVFFYLTSKKQVDFYHSLPVKREKLFITSYTAGVAFYLIPYSINVAASVIVLGGMGYISYLVPSAVLAGYFLNVLLYLVVYTITVFAMMLCGNLVVSLMGTVVFLGYGPLLCVSYTESMRFFYKNYYQLFRAEEMFRNASPVVDFMMANSYYAFSARRVASYVVLTIVLAVLSMYLYKKRPSEAAGRAIAFKVSRSLIKYPIVFLCTIICGLFFMSAGGRSMGWMIFGFICGGTISHFITEIIYHFDFKAIFKNLKGFGVFAALFAIFITIPTFDLTGFDRRLPERSQVKSAKVSIMSFNQSSYFTSMGSMNHYDYRNRGKALLDRHALSKPENIDSVLQIASMGAANTGKDRNGYNASVGVEFELNDGSKLTRKYDYLKSSEIEASIISIFNTDEFKQKLYTIYSVDNKDVTRVAVQDLYSEKGMDRAGQIKDIGKIMPLIDALRSDILKLKGEDMKKEVPVMSLMLFNDDDKGRIRWEIAVPVYASFTQTMGLIKSFGIDMPKMIPSEMVDYIQINNHEYEKYMAMSYAKDRITEFAQPQQRNEVRVDNKNEISEILKSIVPDVAANYNPFYERDYGYRVNVVSARYLNGYGGSFVFKKDSIPEFIKAKFPVPVNIK